MLVKTSGSFASEYGVTFNAKITECICFGKNTCPLQRQVNVNGQRIKWKDKVRYLGNILTKDMCDDADIRATRGEFIGSVNRLNVQFRVVPDQIRIRLLQTYCTAWYGCQTWLLNTNNVKGMNIEWKKAVRRTLNPFVLLNLEPKCAPGDPILFPKSIFCYRSFHVYQHVTSFSHMRGALVGRRTTAAGFHMQNRCDV